MLMGSLIRVWGLGHLGIRPTPQVGIQELILEVGAFEDFRVQDQVVD